METKEEGYILSCFVKTESEKLEKFHIFYKWFKNAMVKKDFKSIEKNIMFPLKGKTCFEGDCDEYTIKKAGFRGIIMDEPYMYKTEYSIEEERLVIWYGYEASYYTLYFMTVDNSWVLMEIMIQTD